MTDIMMVLGAYVFSVDTAAYQTLSRVSSYRWPKQNRLARAPALQFTGPDADTIQVRGTIYPQYRGGLGQIDAMRAEAGQGIPLLLVDGLGHIHGDWAITRIEENERRHFRHGAPKKIDFSVSLTAYGEDAA